MWYGGLRYPEARGHLKLEGAFSNGDYDGAVTRYHPSRPGNPGRFLWISPDCWSLPKRLEFCQLVMTALTHSQNRAEVQVHKSRASSGRRLMCSRDPAEVEALQNEFFKAGIAVATRSNPVAESLGIRAVELWVTDERDFFTASKLYAEMRDRTSGKCGGAGANLAFRGKFSERTSAFRIGDGATVPLQAETPDQHHPKEPEPGKVKPPNRGVNGSNSKHANEPQREALEQASSLLEKEIDDMLKRESELVTECASLRSKMEEMGQALAEARAALGRETESRAAAEREQVKKLSGLQSAM